jgi:hypothetical protein
MILFPLLRNAKAPASLLVVAVLFPVLIQADYPTNYLNWVSCGSKFCATLEFCQDGDSYGYCLPGEEQTGAVYGANPGPLIRMEPGNTYTLTLLNSAETPASTPTKNLHTHGLHIVGDGDGDDVTRLVE